TSGHSHGILQKSAEKSETPMPDRHRARRVVYIVDQTAHEQEQLTKTMLCRGKCASKVEIRTFAANTPARVRGDPVGPPFGTRAAAGRVRKRGRSERRGGPERARGYG